MQKNAFTLVELIVVITILAVLGTIAFVSFQGYAQSSRDSVRVSDLRVIEKALEFELTKNDILPSPDNFITLTASGAIIGYQGYAGIGALGKIGISDRVLDPKDKTEYTYATNESRTKYQLLGFLEAELSNVSQNKVFADLTSRIPLLRGSELGILINNVTNIPAQELLTDVDIQNTNTDYGLLLNNKKNKVNGTGSLLSTNLDFRIHHEGSCFNILKNFKSHGSGIYTIKRGDDAPYEVFCNMDLNDGGWTLILKADGNNQTFTFNSPLWRNTATLNPTDLSLNKTEFKSELFVTQSLREVLLVLETDGKKDSLIIPKIATSLHEIFTSPFSETNIGKQRWLDFVPDGSLQPNCNQEGFNAYRVRIGISSNNEPICSSNDSYIGIGISPRTHSGNYISSVGNNCGSTNCSEGNKQINAFGYIYIR